MAGSKDSVVGVMEAPFLVRVKAAGLLRDWKARVKVREEGRRDVWPEAGWMMKVVCSGLQFWVKVVLAWAPASK